MTKDLSLTIENGLINVKTDDLPDNISSQIKEIEKLGALISEYDKRAQDKITKVKQMTRFEEKQTLFIKHKSGDPKTIINDTQDAVLELAGVLQDTVEAIKKTFEYQAEIAKASSILFQIGTINIASTRLTIKAIHEKVFGASKKTTSENARKELLAVLSQLKEQEDNYNKQQELTQKVKRNTEAINQLEVLLREKENSDKKQQEINQGIIRNAEKIDNLEVKLEEKENRDMQQKNEIIELYNMIKEDEKANSKRRFNTILAGLAIAFSIISITIGLICILS